MRNIKKYIKWLIPVVVIWIAVALFFIIKGTNAPEETIHKENNNHEEKNDDLVAAIGIEYGNTGKENAAAKEQGDGITIYEALGRDDVNLFFTVGKGDKISTLNQLLWEWEEGGIYVDCIEKKVPLIKYDARGYYIYFGFDDFFTVKPKKGTQVSIQGTLTDGINKVKFNPVTFEYDGNLKWKIVSRKRIQPKEAPAVHTKNIKISESDRKDENLFFETSEPHVLTANTLLWEWKKGGVYVNNVLKSVPLVKHSATGYYIYFGVDSFATVNPKKGMRVSLQGVLTDGKNTVEFLPVTFEYQGNMTWKIVSRKEIIPEEDKGTTTKGVVISDSDREEINLFFETNTAHSMNTNTLLWEWKEGGIYVDGIRKSVPLIKWSGTGYYVYFAFPASGVTPTAGTTVGIEGVLTDGKNIVEFLPATFKYDGNKWELISHDPVIPESDLRPEPEPGSKEVYIYSTAKEDSNLWFEVSNNDTFPDNINWGSKAWATADGGLYINGIKQDIPLIKVLGNTYLVYWKDYGITPIKDMVVSIQGEFSDGTNTVIFHPVSFMYDGANHWVLVSREPIVPQEPEKSNVKLLEVWKDDTTLWFATATEDDLTVDVNRLVQPKADGGVYVDGTRVDAPLRKHDATGYYVDWSIAKVTPKKDMIVKVEGTFSDGTNTVTFEPTTFVYNGEGWVLYLEEVTIMADTDRRDGNIWFAVGENSMPSGTYWPYGYQITVNGQPNTSGYLNKYSGNQFHTYGLGTPTMGTTVVIEGTFTNSRGDKIKFKPTVFVYNGTEWVIETQAMPSIKVALSEVWKEDTTLWFTTSEDDGLVVDVNTAVWAQGNSGIYVDGMKVDTALRKHTATGYYVDWNICNVTPVKDMVVKIEGVFSNGTTKVEFEPTTFVYNGEGWVLYKEEVTIEPDTDRKDGNIWFKVSENTMPNGTYWPYGYQITVNGQPNTSGYLNKYSGTQFHSYNLGITPTTGMTVVIEGTFTNGSGDKIKFKPATFVYDGNNWELQ